MNLGYTAISLKANLLFKYNLKNLGFSDDKEILEAVAITGYFNYINTLSNVFGLGQ